MSAALPLHCATAGEPIPERGYRDWAAPDMRAVMPLEEMLAELAHASDDQVEFVALFLSYVAEIGCTVMAHYARDGELGLSCRYPCDPQTRHRNRWMHYLVGRMDRHEGCRDLLLQTLIDSRLCWDERPANPRETTAAVRGFLRVGGRLLIDPKGRLSEGPEIPHSFIRGTPAEARDFVVTSRAYFDARHRWKADRQIKRAVRMLGARTENGWIVLKGEAA